MDRKSLDGNLGFLHKWDWGRPPLLGIRFLEILSTSTLVRSDTFRSRKFQKYLDSAAFPAHPFRELQTKYNRYEQLDNARFYEKSERWKFITSQIDSMSRYITRTSFRAGP